MKGEAMSGQSWRDVIKVHPAADLFPMLPEDELRKLGEDIKTNGLQEKVLLWRDAAGERYVVDGRNRLDAMEAVGLDTLKDNHLNLDLYDAAWNRSEDVDVYAYIISKNIRRRHLTKEQQADLIVKVMKADEVARRGAEYADILSLKKISQRLRGLSPPSPANVAALPKTPSRRRSLRKPRSMASASERQRRQLPRIAGRRGPPGLGERKRLP